MYGLFYNVSTDNITDSPVPDTPVNPDVSVTPDVTQAPQIDYTEQIQIIIDENREYHQINLVYREYSIYFLLLIVAFLAFNFLFKYFRGFFEND